MKGEADVNKTDNAVEIGSYFEQFISKQVSKRSFFQRYGSIAGRFASS